MNEIEEIIVEFEYIWPKSQSILHEPQADNQWEMRKKWLREKLTELVSKAEASGKMEGLHEWGDGERCYTEGAKAMKEKAIACVKKKMETINPSGIQNITDYASDGDYYMAMAADQVEEELLEALTSYRNSLLQEIEGKLPKEIILTEKERTQMNAAELYEVGMSNTIMREFRTILHSLKSE